MHADLVLFEAALMCPETTQLLASPRMQHGAATEVQPVRHLQCLCRDLTGKPNARKKEALRYFSIESAGALVVSLFINVFIMAVFAKGFFGKDIPDIGLANAGRYLGDTFGTPVVNKRLSPEIHRLFTSCQVPSMMCSRHQTCRNTIFA